MENVRHLLDYPHFYFIKGSITSPDVLKDADGIFHQAAIPSVPRIHPGPGGVTNEVNVNGTLGVLVAARKVVYASSSSVYGDKAPSSLDESVILCRGSY